jgi:Trk K+ transport system NAD-binding subunit
MADVVSLAGYNRFNLRRVVIAGGTDAIQVGDRVIVFVVPEAARAVEALFA